MEIKNIKIAFHFMIDELVKLKYKNKSKQKKEADEMKNKINSFLDSFNSISFIQYTTTNGTEAYDSCKNCSTKDKGPCFCTLNTKNIKY